MKNLKKDLQTLDKDLKALSKKVDKMIVAAGMFEKPKVVKKAKAVKAKPIKKVAAKKPAAKEAAKVTAADTVLRTINRYKKGVGTATYLRDVRAERALTPHDFLRYAFCFSFTVNPIFFLPF